MADTVVDTSGPDRETVAVNVPNDVSPTTTPAAVSTTTPATTTETPETPTVTTTTPEAINETSKEPPATTAPTKYELGRWPDRPTHIPPSAQQLLNRVAALNASSPDAISLPVLEHTPHSLHLWGHRLPPADSLRDSINSHFFECILYHDAEAVSDLLAWGLVRHDTLSEHSETPLAAAVLSGSIPVAQALLDAGADVNVLSSTDRAPLRPGMKLPWGHRDMRTPLQIAAAIGRLAMVRYLIEQGHADDALVAPDGALALRLAVAHRRRDIVEYLPARQGGAWLRFRSERANSIRRAKKAAKAIGKFGRALFWSVPRTILWDVPRAIVLDLKRHWRRYLRDLYEFFRDLAEFVWHQIVHLPQNLFRLVKALPGLLKDIGTVVWNVLKDLGKWAWRVIKAIPVIIVDVVEWIYNGLKAIGTAVYNAVASFFSLMRTTVVAVVTFFRHATLRNIIDALRSLLRAVFVSFPRAVWQTIHSLGVAILRMMKVFFRDLWDCLDGFGRCLWILAQGLYHMFMYLPRKLWNILGAMGTAIASPMREVVAYYFPKA